MFKEAVLTEEVTHWQIKLYKNLYRKRELY